MSVMIKGVKRPTGCITCFLMSFGRDDCTMWCQFLDEPLGEWSSRGGNWRHPDCPLVEVPTPHGRLIDASTKIEAQLYDEMTEEWSVATAAVDDFLAFAADLPPTIIEAEGEDHERTD